VTPHLRSYEPGDFEILYEIDQLCYPPRIAYSRRTLRWFLRAPGADCVVAEFEDKIAGFILTESEAGLGHIITIDVLEGYRRSGLGTALLRAAEQHLFERGIRRVELETARDNDAAIAFWQKHGYRTKSVFKRYYPDGADAFSMVKSLGGNKET
jgi:ribosomal-protein-alanine N-acetyltransferase